MSNNKLKLKRWFLGNSIRNYQYFLYNDKYLIVIDPLRGDTYTEYAKEHNLEIIAILVTHRHADHIAGVSKIKDEYPDATIYAYADNERFSPDCYVKCGDEYQIKNFTFRAIYTPGHIDDHVCYFFQYEKLLFTGDTLFNGGVGGVSAASANISQLYNSLKKIYADIDNDAVFLPAHDYWRTNLSFALSLLPDDEKIKSAWDEFVSLDADSKPMLTLEEEHEINIFLIAIFKSHKLLKIADNAEEVFTKIRILKNSFR